MIRSEQHGAVAVVTIDRPERRNALDDEHDSALEETLRQAAVAPAVRVIVLTGTRTAFCSGADLRDRLPTYREKVLAGKEPQWSFGGITGVAPIGVPVVAAINGYAIAGGLELALACDIRICVPEASFAMAETRWAITPGAGGTQRLPRIIGVSAALDLLLTARSMGAEEALRCGLVSRIVEAPALLDEAIATATAIAENGPLAVAAVRRVVAAGADLGLAEALDLERHAFLSAMRTVDAREGSTAFVEKRRPDYRGG